MLPPLHRLPLQTGEFHSLSQAEVDALNKQEVVDPITLEPFRLDARRHGLFGWRKFVPGVRLNENTWRTFRVRSKDKNPNGDYTYQYYRSKSLWGHYNRLVGGLEPRDPLTRQRIWYEVCTVHSNRSFLHISTLTQPITNQNCHGFAPF